MSLYRHTKDKKYLYRALKFAESAASQNIKNTSINVPDHPYSLFEGEAGAICYYSDMLAPEDSRFPAYERPKKRGPSTVSTSDTRPLSAVLPFTPPRGSPAKPFSFLKEDPPKIRQPNFADADNAPKSNGVSKRKGPVNAPTKVLLQVKAVHKYEPPADADHDILSLEPGDIISVYVNSTPEVLKLGGEAGEWYGLHERTGQAGFFPVYLTIENL